MVNAAQRWLCYGWLCSMCLPLATAEAAPPDETAVSLAPYRASDTIHHHVLDATGYTLPGGRAELGLWYFGYGITDWLTVGTMPGPWLIAPVLGGYSINVSVKLGFAVADWLQLGLEVHPLWLHLDASEQSARALIIPVTAAATLTPNPTQSYSLAVRYADVEAASDGTLKAREVRGAAVVRVVQLIAQAEWQVSKVLALYVQGQLQLWQQNVRLRARGQTLDARTTVDIDAEASAIDSARPWAAVGGLAFSWGPASLRVGAGYGHVFVPRFGMPLRTYEGVLPDVNFFFRF